DTIGHCSAVPTLQNYIKKNYAKNTYQWSLWTCQHFPLLLQVISTNPLESFHNEIKRVMSSLHSLISI
ncbi:24143_t:CDS:1, partial [Racocetra persica]